MTVSDRHDLETENATLRARVVELVRASEAWQDLAYDLYQRLAQTELARREAARSSGGR
jgi:hypothetical protein